MTTPMPDEMSVSRIVFDRDENHLPCSDADRDWLIAEVESLEAELKDDRGVRAVVMNEQYAELDGLPEKSMRIYEAIRSLRQQVERLEEAWDALPRSEAVDQLIASRAEIKRLEVAQNEYRKEDDAITKRLANARAEGMEAAMKVFDGLDEQLMMSPNSVRRRLRAAAKQQTGEADSRECSLSASGESRAPASPSPGSASPVNLEAKVERLEAKNKAGYEAIAMMTGKLKQLKDEIERLTDKSEADANNADFRDGGYGKDPP